MKLKGTFLIFSMLGLINLAKAQTSEITTAVPFLTICPDARGTSLGWTGAATSPDIFSQSQNPAKYAFFRPKKSILSEWNYRFLYKQDTCAQDSIFRIFRNAIIENVNQPNFECIDSSSISDNFSLALSYTPWLRSLVTGMNLAYLVGYKRLDDQQTISASLRYFTLPEISFMNEYGDLTGHLSPHEFALDMSYSRLLTANFSGAITFRYIRSDITSGQLLNGVQTHAGNSIASDIAFYYFKKNKKGMNNKIFSTGLYISNIGSNISYDQGKTKKFLPSNMKLGIAYSTEVDRQNSITIALDANKLLVPSLIDSNAEVGYNKSVVAGIFSSFTDAPGGFSEELKEIRLSGGIEYAYQQNYFLRAGYFYEDVTKGNRKFFTTGVGANLIIYSLILSIDAAYLIPIYQNDPLGKTSQISMSFTF